MKKTFALKFEAFMVFFFFNASIVRSSFFEWWWRYFFLDINNNYCILCIYIMWKPCTEQHEILAAKKDKYLLLAN